MCLDVQVFVEPIVVGGTVQKYVFVTKRAEKHAFFRSSFPLPTVEIAIIHRGALTYCSMLSDVLPSPWKVCILALSTFDMYLSHARSNRRKSRNDICSRKTKTCQNTWHHPLHRFIAKILGACTPYAFARGATDDVSSESGAVSFRRCVSKHSFSSVLPIKSFPKTSPPRYLRMRRVYIPKPTFN